MCAEFTPGQPLEVSELLQNAENLLKILRNDWNFRVFPRGDAPIVIRNPDGKLALIDAEFSLIPAWWNPEKAKKKTKDNRPTWATHNARLNTIDELASFKDSFKKRHCIIPMHKFYESSLFGTRFAGNRLEMEADELLLAAGCYAEWLNKETGELIVSFTIITDDPNVEIFSCGHDRMPVFLTKKHAIEWLEMENEDSTIQKKFLVRCNIRKDLKLQISIDRPLKDGWQKRAPSEEELEEIRKMIGA